MITPPDRLFPTHDDPEDGFESVLPDWTEAAGEQTRLEDSL